MAKTIVWNKRASNSLNNIIAYLRSDWNDAVIQNFVTRTYQLIELISENPEIGTLENPGLQIRAIVLTKHNILYYRYNHEQLIILNIFDTRQSPSKKKF